MKTILKKVNFFIWFRDDTTNHREAVAHFPMGYMYVGKAGSISLSTLLETLKREAKKPATLKRNKFLISLGLKRTNISLGDVVIREDGSFWALAETGWERFYGAK